MTRDDLKRLQEYRGYPALSLRVPTHRRHPEASQDPTRLKNLIRRAATALQERNISGAMVHDYITRLETFQRQLDWRHLDQGLCIFVAPGRLAWVMLPEPVDETVVVGETFLTRDLVRAASRTPRYRLVVLSREATRWFEGWGGRLAEETGHAFPMRDEISGGEPAEGFNRGVDPRAYDNECARLFVRRVAEEVRRRLNRDPAPLFVAGVERLQALFQEAVGDGVVAGRLAGSHDQQEPHELAAALAPVVERWQQGRRRDVLKRFEDVRGTAHGVTGLRDVGAAAAMARVETLLVESPYQISGSYDRETGRVITVASDGAPAAGDHDVVDEIVETVMERGGETIFYQGGRLDGAGAPIGAILRF